MFNVSKNLQVHRYTCVTYVTFITCFTYVKHASLYSCTLKEDAFCDNEITSFLSSLNYNDPENHSMYKHFADYELIKTRFGETLDINIYPHFI